LISSLINGSAGSYLMELLYRLPAILVAIAFHEWAHAYAAYKRGDPTAYNLGRMSLNPFDHLDITGFIMLVVFRFGWAKPVPINTRNFSSPRKDEIIVSLAGVVTNLILAFISMGLFFLLVYGFNYYNDALVTIIYYFYFINMGLCVFNLLPIPPLDGYRVAACLLSRKIGYRTFEFLERYGFAILVVLLLTGTLSSIMSGIISAVMSGMLSIYSRLFSLFGVI